MRTPLRYIREIGRALVLDAGLIATAMCNPSEVMFRYHGGAEIAVQLLGSSGPVVVFESGMAEDMRNWGDVAHPLAACARVVLYDRLGVGRSSPRSDTNVVLASAVAKRLADLLAGLRISTPYILVGHSLGGLYVQSFARKYPQHIAGVVLVDAASPLEPPGVFVPTVPPPPGTTAAAEEGGVAPSVNAILAGPPFPPLPLTVLVATNHGDTPEREALWRDVQARTAALSPKGRLEIVDGSGHFIQKDRPQAVIAAVQQVMRAAGNDVSRCNAPALKR
jgi:pimeloyl-ACP methyl ester carboxylesterase